jgi:cellulose synthase/poly-beta-1,6-N-acetylglucosamine synthase-like glycosyltransferase
MTITTQYPATWREQLPEIDCVVIGVNASATLHRCLSSIINCDYPPDALNIVYVDGGSIDESIAIAESFTNVRIVRLDLEHPTPGRGRNRGWKAGVAPLVQFLDSDTVLDKDWFRSAVKQFHADVGAVAGNRNEIHPEKSVYNWIGNLEWNGRPGDAECFGGDVLIRRQALEETCGYDDELVGGEDPELSVRIRSFGWRIRQIDAAMTSHDLAMTTFTQYFRRVYRSGYAFAAVIDRCSDMGVMFWRKEFRRILIRGGGFVGFSFLAVLAFLLLPPTLETLISALLLLGSALVLLFYPRLFRVDYFMEDKQLNRSQAQVYAWHCSLVVLPDIVGVARYYLGKTFNRPLRNSRRKLTTSTLQPQL